MPNALAQGRVDKLTLLSEKKKKLKKVVGHSLEMDEYLQMWGSDGPVRVSFGQWSINSSKR